MLWCSFQAEYYELGKQRQAVKKLEGACQKRVDTLLKRMDALQQEGRSGHTHLRPGKLQTASVHTSP